jgi:hypothetical protein
MFKCVIDAGNIKDIFGLWVWFVTVAGRIRWSLKKQEKKN